MDWISRVVVGLGAIGVLLYLAFWVVVVVIAIHFVGKYW